MKRHLTLGDIDGCYEALRDLCDFVELRADDTLIMLRDYCNYGPNTNAVQDWLIHLEFICNLRPLRGNHDIMMLNARKANSAFRQWLDVGGDKTLQSYERFHLGPGTL